MAKLSRGQKIDTVFVLMVFCVFAVSVLTVLMLGGNTYKNMIELSREGYNEQTCLSYIWSKIKNGDESGNISVGEFYGLSVLCLNEDYGGVSYRTMIYLHDGWVCELFSEAGLEFSPEDGTPFIEAESLTFEQLENGLIRATSGAARLLIFPRGQAGLASVEHIEPVLRDGEEKLG